MHIVFICGEAFRLATQTLPALSLPSPTTETGNPDTSFLASLQAWSGPLLRVVAPRCALLGASRDSPQRRAAATAPCISSHLKCGDVMRSSGSSLTTRSSHEQEKPTSHAYRSIRLERARVLHDIVGQRNRPQQLLAVRLLAPGKYKLCFFKPLSAGLPVPCSRTHPISYIIQQTFIKFLSE